MRKRKGDKQLAEGLDLETFVVAGTEAAFGALDPREAEDPVCVRCGAPIKYVLVTNKGTMGGDCYATLTGDDSTRKQWRKISKSLDNAFLYGKVKSITVEHQVKPINYKQSVITAQMVGQGKDWFLGVIKGEPEIALGIASSLADQYDLTLYEES